MARLAMADPPYVGQSKKHYGEHPDYAGEVDHAALIQRLETEYDGWALCLSARSLHEILPMTPPDVVVLSWVKPIAPPMGDHYQYSWEPVIVSPVRRPATYVKTHLVLSPPQYTFRPKPPGHVIGEKPEGFSLWVFEAMGAEPGDTMDDLFPGSGAVSLAWERFGDGRLVAPPAASTAPHPELPLGTG